MSIKSQFMLALGVLSAVLLASANPGLAKTAHHRTHATDGVQAPYGARAEQRAPFAYAPGYQAPAGYGYDSPRATSRPDATWDPYGLRWDGGN